MTRATIASRVGLAVTLFAIGCTESIGPERGSPGVPRFSYSASGITLNQQNGSLSESGRLIVKGFNPTNPHRGDAIIATFFWLGSTFIIDSVRDVLTTSPTYTPVGNTYHLVEYIQAGGYSMATYVATNVLNFPDPADPAKGAGDIYAVGAYLSQSVADGGVSLSSWTGVEDNFATALGGHSSATGSGAGGGAAAPAQAGPIPVNAGAVVHTVTMSGLFGLDYPQGYTGIGQGTDNSMKEGTAYAVQTSAGTTNPSWTWFMGSPGTWLATTFALNAAPPPGANQSPTAAFTSSCSNLTCSFTNTSSDPDGSISASSWDFGDGQTSTVASPTHSYAAAGTYNVTLTVTDNLGATNSVVHSVMVSQANQSPTAAFTSSCSNLTCSFTNTSSDPDGSISASSWDFGDGQTSTVASPSHSYAAAGPYNVTLTVTDNQGATNSVVHSVTVSQANQAPTANFTFSCSGLNCNFTSTSSDPDGSIASYSWTFGDGSASTAQNPSHSYGATGGYSVTLRVTDNQGAQSPVTTKTVNVTAPNQPPTANFTFSCSGLTCNFTSTSRDPDGSIASYSWNFGDGATSTAQNPSRTYTAGGNYSVTLRVTDNQGAQSTTTSKTVTVTAPNSAPVVNAGPDAHALTGLLWSTSFSFSDANGNGPWSYTINWGDGTTSSGTRTTQGSFTVGHTYIIILPRSFTITATVRDAAGASGSDSKVVSVTLL